MVELNLTCCLHVLSSNFWISDLRFQISDFRSVVVLSSGVGGGIGGVVLRSQL